MNKTELINNIAQVSCLSKYECSRVINLFKDLIIDNLCRGEKVSLNGFGTFYLKTKQSREIYIPSTKRKMITAQKLVASFKPGADLQNLVK